MIEFGESSTEALAREIKEEISQEIKNVKYLGTLENIFTYNGNPGHEIILVYDAEFVKNDLYKVDRIRVDESDIWYDAFWLPINDCREGKYILYPEGLLKLI